MGRKLTKQLKKLQEAKYKPFLPTLDIPIIGFSDKDWELFADSEINLTTEREDDNDNADDDNKIEIEDNHPLRI